MAKFNAKAHDLSRGEASFLTELSKLSLKGPAQQVDKAAAEISNSLRAVDKARADSQKKIDAAVVEVKAAIKKHGDLQKKLQKAEALLLLIEKSPPVAANVMAKKLEKLCGEVTKCQGTISKCLTKAETHVGLASGLVMGMPNSTNVPGMRLVPSLPKVLILAP